MSVVRDAMNRVDFLEEVRREAGFEVEHITGVEEARRTLLGIRSGLPTEGKGWGHCLTLHLVVRLVSLCGGGDEEVYSGRRPSRVTPHFTSANTTDTLCSR